LAEVLVNHYGSRKYQAYSAGSFPTGQVNLDSLVVLDRYHLPYNELKSQSWDDFSQIDFDIVITVCDNAANETCPIYLGHAIKAHWGIPDPDKVTGKGRAEAFELAFAQLKQRIEKLLNLIEINSDTLNHIGKISL